ncbi:MAG: hypothetical protein M4D85_10875, partial [Actinomycetota bacterium]|nr:hypothetical protein [Actinomycetota bacterium]
GKGEAAGPFTLDLSRTGGACEGFVLDRHDGAETTAVPAGTKAVLLTDTSRLGLNDVEASAFRTSLGRLGAVVDAAQVPRLQLLNAQADRAASCPYAKNLVAQALREIVAPGASSVTSVTIAGDDGVVPFFRYPDTAGLAPESDYVPPVDGASASAASLGRDTVLGQDAYGAAVDVSIKGTDVPVPLLPVGRLVETPTEILTAVDAGLARPVLPSGSSLVTGYDFLTDAADAVSAQLRDGTGQAVDELITESGVPVTQTTVEGAPDRQHAWTATDLGNQLLERRHDLVYLAGHFSGNSALAADEKTSLLTSDLAARPLALQDSLVLSAGCHSGYNIVDREGIQGVTNGLDWAQEMARQQAVLVAGTGYQYGDTDFLAYSERLYLGLVRELRRDSGAPVAVGEALVSAKQEYLSSTATLTGMDLKSLLEVTVYGLPTRSVDLPGRIPTDAPAPLAGAVPVVSGPGAQLALSTVDTTVQPTLTPQAKELVGLDGAALSLQASWLSGLDGVATTPAAPALPLQVLPVEGPQSSVLRGVALRSADYDDRTGVTPLTGAPAIERSGVHTSFSSPAFWPQTVARANQFGALASGDGTGTSLVMTPAQYRSDSPGSTTATERAYRALGLSLFWSGRTDVDGAAGSAPPSLSGVRVVEEAGRVRVSAHATADPRAGLQQVWATYTAEVGSWHRQVRPLDLRQDAADSTLWTGTVDLPADVPASSARFVLTAVSGVGLVGTDTAYGDGYVPEPATPGPAPATVTLSLTAPPSAVHGELAQLTASNAPPGAAVQLELGTSTAVAVTDSDGNATAQLRVLDPPGTLATRATYAGDTTHLPAAVRGPGVVTALPATTLEITPLTGPLG